MKFIIVFLAVLAVVSANSEESAEEAPVFVTSDEYLEEPVSGRYSLILGSIGNGNLLLHRNTYTRSAKPNTVQWQELTYNGASNIRITCIRVVEVGTTQYATARVLSGGIGKNFVKIRMQTATGRGYKYNVEIWGRRI
ncbi:unnamed protein product [Chrysodeixis includens]|uniref:Salivary secreted peptide n=1 Tax=Chrysodeixis includens TaxID=689277 RepID=A0A9P0BW34_CHRIL|nr:unnamed protein product [Chrysodeixis includens]